MKSRQRSIYIHLMVLALVTSTITGCASTNVVATNPVSDSVTRPDFILVHDFAVTAAQVNLDQSVIGNIGRDEAALSLTEEAENVGLLVAGALAEELVGELRDKGISAHRAASAPPVTDRTVHIRGFFESIDEGSATERTIVGFGLGASELRARYFVSQGIGGSERIVSEGVTVAKGSLKPGMAASAGVGLARGAVGSAVAVSGARSAAGEKFMDTVQADARRTAQEATKKIVNYYKSNGWL